MFLGEGDETRRGGKLQVLGLYSWLGFPPTQQLQCTKAEMFENYLIFELSRAERTKGSTSMAFVFENASLELSARWCWCVIFAGVVRA
jgi:hypothetical protein